MDTIRYWVVLILLIGTPPGIFLWYFIHPFSGFWRRLGPWVTYSILLVPVAISMYGVYLLRGPLMAVDFGTSGLTILLGILVAGVGALIGLKRRRYLTTAILSGIPQLSEKQYPGTLLKEGIYGRVRHPRYMEVTFFVLSYALFGNFLAGYLAFILTLPALFLVVLMEERELEERFGDEWREYANQVPRFIPRRG